MTTPRTADHEGKFIAYLQGLQADRYRGRRAMAQLRRGLGKGPWEAHEMHQWVAPWFGLQPAQWRETCYFSVAALFALHPLSYPPPEDEERPRSLGYSLHQLNQLQSDAPVKRRLTNLLSADRDTLFDHMGSIVRLLRQAAVPLDWAQLLRDVIAWGPGVQTNWARDFFSKETSS